MRIRAKIIAIVLPLLIVALVIGGVSASFIATNAVTRVAVEFLEFKTDELEKYVQSQWSILVDNDLVNRTDMVQAAQAGIEVFARSIIRSETELIFALDASGEQALASGDLQLAADEAEALQRTTALGDRTLQTAEIGGEERVFVGFPFEPFGWSFYVSELRSEFYSDVDRITLQTLYLVVIGSIVAIVLVFFVVRYLTEPLRTVVSTMGNIIRTNDLGSRVTVQFNDEIGELSDQFNVMTSELEKAQDQIKSYAYQTVLSQRSEQRVRQIFQKYVPQEVIDRFFRNPESMLVGENREIAVLFSDIRGFTTISEAMEPDQLVEALNRYFSIMVDRILDRGGVIDKYIGDAIMAIFGAPVEHENDAGQAILAGLDMLDAVEPFNRKQAELGQQPFHIGVGLDYGTVTVGNIGTERKMDYTVIGDRVNVASRLEGLTKKYRQPLLFSEALADAAAEVAVTRRIAKVAVKGRLGGLEILTASRSLSEREERGWKLHNEAMALYYDGSFADARRLANEARESLPDDFLVEGLIARCDELEGQTDLQDGWAIDVQETK
jgi:class 3 adenylate cyclase/HAMP domain-containing protein